MRKGVSILVAGFLALSVAACGSTTTSRAVTGGLIGAGVGLGAAALTGGSLGAGAAIGGVGGAVLGGVSD